MNDPSTWAKQAMDHMAKHGLPPTPENFAVFYSFYSGDNPNLKMAMSTLVENGAELTPEQCKELYVAHVGLEAENKVLQDASRNISQEIHSVMAVLQQSSNDSSRFDQTLSNFSGALQSPASLDQLRSAVVRVANETRMMAEQNQRLHSQLTQSTQQLTEMRYNLDKIRQDSLIDPLTGVGNRKHFNDELKRVLQESKEMETNVSLLIGDIDFFKKFNDTYGHLIGDEVLKLVAKTLVENLKGRDIIARYGGEEFVILLPQTTVQDAERVGNQLRNILATKQVKRRRTNETLGVVTMSFGAAQYRTDEDPESLIERADEALYQAKQTGRNKVVIKE